jgi:hypothetical protein
MYNVRILRILPYFYHCLTLLVFSCLFWISNKSFLNNGNRQASAMQSCGHDLLFLIIPGAHDQQTSHARALSLQLSSHVDYAFARRQCSSRLRTTSPLHCDVQTIQVSASASFSIVTSRSRSQSQSHPPRIERIEHGGFIFSNIS